MAGKHGKHGKAANGAGSIFERPNVSPGSRWCGQISLPDGKRKAIYAPTQAECLKKVRAALAALDIGLPVASDERLTVGDYLADWLERIKPSVRPSTYQRYRELLAHVISKPPEPLARLPKLPLAKLTAHHLERLYAEMQGPNGPDGGWSSSTAHRLHSVLHRALKDAMRKNLIPRNPTELLDAPKDRPHRIAPLTVEQVATFLQAAQGDRYEALYTLAVAVGMRQGELLALRWRDVDLDAATVQVRGSMRRETGIGLVIGQPKTKQGERRIDLPHLAVEALRRHRARQAEERLRAGALWEDRDLVFCTPIGSGIDAKNFTVRAYHPLLERAGLPPIRFHDLRHTAATLLLLGNVPAKVVSEMLGHASIDITLNTYSHVLPSMQKDAAAVMDALLGNGTSKHP